MWSTLTTQINQILHTVSLSYIQSRIAQMKGRRYIPDSNVHGTNIGPTWFLSAPDGPHDPCYQGCKYTHTHTLNIRQQQDTISLGQIPGLKESNLGSSVGIMVIDPVLWGRFRESKSECKAHIHYRAISTVTYKKALHADYSICHFCACYQPV